MSKIDYSKKRSECWAKAFNEGKKFDKPDSMFIKAEIFYVIGELYFRIEQLENELEIYRAKQSSRNNRGK